MKRLAQDAPFYEAKTFHFPDGGVETVAWRRIERGSGEPRAVVIRSEEEQARRDQENREFSARRAKSKLRRIVRTLGLDRMLTFTTREAVTAYDALVADWDGFRRAIKKAVPEFVYAAVVEPHPSNPGHYHIHVAVRGFHDVNTLRRVWHGVLRKRIKVEGSPGNVHVIKKQGGTAQKLSKYLAKYLGKTFDAPAMRGRKSYWTTAKASVLKVARWFPCAETWIELERELVGDPCIRDVRHFNPGPGVLWLEGEVCS